MPERLLVSLEDVTLTFGGRPLFEGVNLHVSEGDKICLIGRNGAGKTTLMRLITEELELDSGRRFALPGLRIGYLAQSVPFLAGETVKQFVLSGLPEEERNEANGHLADIVIAPLEVEPEARMETLSGGQLRRASLARALVYQPDILLLDEPTNHLDLAAIEWLERYLAAYRGAVLCVSHDRAFLSAVSRKVFWIERGRIRTCPKGYSEFDDWAESVIAQEARELHNMERKLEAEVDWTQGGVSGRRKRNQRRLRELNRLREKLKTDRSAHNQRLRAIDIDPLKSPPASKIVAEFRQVSKSFTRQDGRKIPILEDFSFRILRGDRIGILGRNGSGKSTFLKLLMQELEPDEGRIFRGKNLEMVYFDQNRADLNPKKSVWDTLVPGGGDYVALGSGGNLRHRHVCAYLKDFLFDPRIARDVVATLSGGMQNRLLLARALANPGNVLILDEPTNDLDMDTLDMLQEILADYDGTLLLVSHDRDFLDRTVTEVLAFEGEAKVEGYIGGYSDYLEAKRKRLDSEVASKPARVSETSAPAVSAPAKSSGKMSFKLKHELETLPARIAGLEAELTELRGKLADPEFYTREPEAFDKASRRFAKAQSELEAAEHRWLELEELRLAE